MYHENCDLIGRYTGDSIEASLEICHRLPIGTIGDPEIDASHARRIVEGLLGNLIPVVHLALTEHITHNWVNVISFPSGNQTEVADAVICPLPNANNPCVYFDTFVADCFTGLIIGEQNAAFFHAGAQEMFYDLMEWLKHHWHKEMVRSVIIGPGIRGKHYEYDPGNVPEEVQEFMVETAWGTKGFDILPLIRRELVMMGIDEEVIQISGVDPFAELEKDANSRWSSFRWHEKNGFPTPRELSLAKIEYKA